MGTWVTPQLWLGLPKRTLTYNKVYNKVPKLFSRLDCGTGPGIVRSTSRANLGRWNRLTVFRHDWGVWLQLNGGQHEEGRSQVSLCQGTNFPRASFLLGANLSSLRIDTVEMHFVSC